MKKLLSVLLAFMMMLSFVACDLDKDSSDSKSGKSSSSSSDKKKEPSDIGSSSTSSDDSAEDAVRKYVNKSKAGLESSLSNETYEIKIKAEGTKVVYEFQYKTVETSPELEAALEEQLDTMEATFEGLLEAMQAEEPAVTGIVYEYYDCNGEFVGKGEV